MVFGFGYGGSFQNIDGRINAAISNWKIAIKNIGIVNLEFKVKLNWKDAQKAANRLKKEFERLARFAEAHFLLLNEFFIHINKEEVRLGEHGDTVDKANIIQAELLHKLEFLWKEVDVLANDINPKSLSPTNIDNSISVYKENMLPLFRELTDLVGREESNLHKLFEQFKKNPSKEAKRLVKDVKAAESKLEDIIK